MNKHSKYRQLLDEVECEIMRAEVGVTGVYRYMLEALDEAEAVETALREELAALKQSIPKIRADAIMSLRDLGSWDGREDGEYYYSASTIKKFAAEIEDES